ncbi:MAG: AAA family ATPase [Candidatus Latescibacteria bacterium]|nr:AAA family ATPase [Candidatus Latescibacterota bacterium]
MVKIVMINGAFGVGKTTLADGLAARIPNSLIYDPEEVGQMLRKITKETGDFQDIALWPSLTVDIAGRLFSTYKRSLIIPMTLAHVPYFKEIKDGLSNLTSELYHFCLTASIEVIHQRLERRGDIKGSWTFQQTARCVEAHREAIFSEHIDTENMDSRQIQELILSRI